MKLQKVIIQTANNATVRVANAFLLHTIIFIILMASKMADTD